MEKVFVVVLGDVGRSPRMQYHALSFAKENFNVTVIGYRGSKPHQRLIEDRNISLQFIPSTPTFYQYLPRLFAYIFKTMFQSILLLLTFIRCGTKPSYIVVQNPPAIPSLFICWLFCIFCKSKLVIDWHNYGYTILSLTLGESHSLVKLSRWYEGWVGFRAYRNLCVTKAMKEDLKKRWDIEATVLYDRPTEIFRPATLKETHALWTRLADEYSIFRCSMPGKTVFTEMFSNGRVCLREDRPALLVSSTSWTEDEDFGILLDALQMYEDSREADQDSYPQLICVITGKGPLKNYYNGKIESKQWKHVCICTPWLQPEDYPTLLASADLGVCLHTSSSGLDLPMKVVDMFGCALPVFAIDFRCLSELVRHQENGIVFHASEDLTENLLAWFKNFPNANECPWKEIMYESLQSYQTIRWHDTWTLAALPLFRRQTS